MDLTIGMDSVLLNLDNNQRQFQNTVTQLSSGLRINTAADDPSGNAIATNLQSKTQGLQQAVQNVQNANNALNVAMGALTAVQTILERINTLIVESNSDINSSSDLQNIQAEINQLLLEINRISQNTNFNGQKLLDGTYDTSSGSPAQFSQVASPFGGSSNVSNFNGLGQAGPLIFDAGVPPGGYFQPSLLTFTVTGYSDNALDPDSNTYVGPGVYVQFDAYSSAGFSGAPLYQDVSAIPVNSGQITGAQYVTPDGSSILLQFSLANLTSADVGATISFQSTDSVAPAGGKLLTVNDGGSEGQIVGVSLPTVSTNALGISDISVVSPATVNINDQSSGTSSSNNMAASYSELLIGEALTKITTAQAQIGAQVVALNVDATNGDTAVVNYQQAASNITDLNIGQATTDYTRQQILTNVGTSVLSQMETDAKQTTALLILALVA